jgi:LAGLIDADG endonuclease
LEKKILNFKLVDTSLVSLDMVTYFIIIWLFAGNFLLRVSPPMFIIVGKIFNSYLIFNKLYFLFKKKLNEKKSADNPLVPSNFEKTEVISNFDEQLISEDLFISDHLKKHKKPKTDIDLGYYLAGLIEGDGYIGESKIEIAFHTDDISSAYFIKKIIGYGSVLICKELNSVRYVLVHKLGLQKMCHLINGKFLGQHKIDQLLKLNYDIKFGYTILPKANFDILTNYWLAGFSDAQSSFGIYIYSHNFNKTGINISLSFRIKQKNPELLNLVANALGGNVYKLIDNMYSYSTINFKNAFNVVNYFDNFHLLNASKLINYIKWRKAYRIIQRKEHLTFEGINKIRKLQENLRD